MFGLGAWIAETALGKWFAGSAAKSFLTAIPRPVWEALTVLAYVVALFALHQHYVHAHDAKLTASINAEWQRKLDAQVAEIKQKDAQLATISAQLRKANDEANRAIAADARDLRLRGPGKATCPRISGAPAASGGHNQAPAVPDAAGPALPTDDLAAVPWGWLTDRAEEHDQLLAEVQAWRTWHGEVLKAWPKK